LFFFFNYEGLRDHDVTFENQFVDTPQLDQTLLAARPNTPVAATLSAAGLGPRINQLLPINCSLWIAANEPCAVVNGGINIGSPTPNTSTQGFGNYVYSFGCQNTLANPNPSCPGTVNPSCPPGSVSCVLPNFVGEGLTTTPDLEFAQIFLPTNQSGNQYNARVDYVLGQNTFSGNMFLTYMNHLGSDDQAQGRPMADVIDHRPSPSGFLSWVSVISPTLVNEARFNFARFGFNEITSDPSVNWAIPRTEIQGLPLPGGQRIRFEAPQGDATPGIFGENTFAFREMISKVRGTHALKFGVDGDRYQDYSNLNCNARPDIVFNGGVRDNHDTNAFLPPVSSNFPNPLASFTLQTTGTSPMFPGIGRNSFRGPRYGAIDMSIQKTFGLPNMKFVGEAAKIQLRMNPYNAFNKLNLDPFTFGSNSTTIATCCAAGPPNTPLLNPNFGLADFVNGGGWAARWNCRPGSSSNRKSLACFGVRAPWL
jgi:hypothetical protein